MIAMPWFLRIKSKARNHGPSVRTNLRLRNMDEMPRRPHRHQTRLRSCRRRKISRGTMKLRLKSEVFCSCVWVEKIWGLVSQFM
ncbi:hypothetical protein KSP40_PGU016979 [Platanthera guangdongensis]|uniref:Uncharacterized protein n=1 Tax=Platanthera guangdongensis TaxID=2320717 RepID=A0ABR2MYY5_9ASPA